MAILWQYYISVNSLVLMAYCSYVGECPCFSKLQKDVFRIMGLHVCNLLFYTPLPKELSKHTDPYEDKTNVVEWYKGYFELLSQLFYKFEVTFK